jgi:hypothetical protein
MTYKFLDVPEIPEELILPLDEVLQLENIFGGATNNYTIHECQPELRDWLKSHFPDCTKFRYQTLIDEIPVHKDRGRDIAINYILDTGGDDVKTVWYEEDWTTATHDMIFPAKKWHEIDVSIYHGVSGLTSRRWAITVA